MNLLFSFLISNLIFRQALVFAIWDFECKYKRNSNCVNGYNVFSVLLLFIIKLELFSSSLVL